jgi:two-component system, NtrC family, sensor kinase
LQAIVGKADLGRSDTDLEKMRLKFELILVAADRASLILRNLQSFSKGSPERTKTRVSQVLKDTLLLVNHELKKSTITVTENFGCEGLIHVSPSKLEQVFLNLLINAQHAMGKGGKIEIGCEENEKTVTAWVKDTGSGIPPEVLPKIFDYAFTTKGEQGSGLGLAISKDIIEEYGGTIEVETKVGVGTSFFVKLPRLRG